MLGIGSMIFFTNPCPVRALGAVPVQSGFWGKDLLVVLPLKINRKSVSMIAERAVELGPRLIE